jgi:hypothetical protein
MQCPKQLEIASGQTNSRSGRKISSKPTSRRRFSESIVGKVDRAGDPVTPSKRKKQTESGEIVGNQHRQATSLGSKKSIHIALYDHSTIETFIADIREYPGTYRADMLLSGGSVPLMHPSPCGHPPRRRGSSSGTN